MSIFEKAAELLCTVLTDGLGADRTVFRYFQAHPQFGSRDRRIISDAVYGCLRRLRTFGHALGQREHADWHLTGSEARGRVAMWMLSEGNRSREEIASLLGRDADLVLANVSAEPPPAVAADLPDGLYDMLTTELGVVETHQLAQALVKPAPLDLRVNTLHTNRAQVIRILQDEGLEPRITPFSPVGLRLPARTAFSEHHLYRRGLVEIQDEGSQLIALLLAPRRHEIVVDFCAGAGGKTLHLGALMANTGAIHAFDNAAYRLDELRRRVERAGVTRVRIARIDSLTAPPILALRGKADRVLVDAPCTGSGTFRRSPDIKWRCHDLPRLTSEQRQILAAAATLVRRGGHLVYSTCSLLPLENEAIVDDFLGSHPNFMLITPHHLSTRLNLAVTTTKERSALRLYPHRHDTDGFYAALLERIV